eukprot:7390682-Prymnesium_polylepis.1
MACSSDQPTELFDLATAVSSISSLDSRALDYVHAGNSSSNRCPKHLLLEEHPRCEGWVPPLLPEQPSSTIAWNSWRSVTSTRRACQSCCRARARGERTLRSCATSSPTQPAGSRSAMACSSRSAPPTACSSRTRGCSRRASAGVACSSRRASTALTRSRWRAPHRSTCAWPRAAHCATRRWERFSRAPSTNTGLSTTNHIVHGPGGRSTGGCRFGILVAAYLR